MNADFKYTEQLQTNACADKAVIGMMLLRLDRCGRKGVGPNRDDLPLFRRVAGLLVNGGFGDARGETRAALWQARHRVRKYHRQLSTSEYAPLIFGDAPITEVAKVYDQRLLEAEVAESIEDHVQEHHYGGW